MNYTEPRKLDGLAERFVLGTMGRRARRRFGRLVDENEDVAASVYRLEGMLSPAAWALEPVMPSELVWQRIARDAGLGRRRMDSRPRRTAWPAVAAVLTAALFVTTFGWWQAQNRPPQIITETVTETVVEPVPLEPAVGIVADAQGNPLWVARIYSDLQRAEVAVGSAPEAQPANDYELWILRDDGVPVSLGLLPQAGEATLALDADALDALTRGSTLAVSLEPPGGSPEPIPTGPVLYTAALLAP
ncbi:MAG: anti-sigma factor [Woeseiaceae bacterium]|nr:anti-sigma factor [Woeseiaceae bacterium]